MKDANPGSTNDKRGQTTLRQSSQSVISFDFNSMFDEYKKSQQLRTKSFKQSFKHFPRSFRASSKRKRAPTQTQQQSDDDEKNHKINNEHTASSGRNNKEISPSQNNVIINPNTTEKEKRKLLFKAKNKTLQHRRKDDEEIQRRKMPPKSISFDEGNESIKKGKTLTSLPFTLSSNIRNDSNDIDNKNQPAEFFIDFEDSAAKASIGSRSGSNVSLINTIPLTVTKSSKMKNSDSVKSTLDNQSNHSNNNNSSFSNRIYDSFKRKKSRDDNNKNTHQNKLTQQKSLCNEDGTLVVNNQSEDVKNNTPTSMNQSETVKNNTQITIANQSNSRLTHVKNRSNELVKGMNLEAYDTFV